jgi:protein TilB
MPQITRELLRKRAEHNEGMISTLEEISLHQEEIERINEVLGSSCRKIKILYLQNNIIPKIENLQHLKELEYLNLALNNITRIEGLQNCEFLRKLDLTVNFIDVDELKESMEHLAARDRLRELYMMGNPAQVNWPGFESYIIAKLPNLETLDGKEITRSMQIIARQQLDNLETELEQLAAEKRVEKELKRLEKQQSSDCDIEIVSESVQKQEDLTENTPEVRVEVRIESKSSDSFRN